MMHAPEIRLPIRADTAPVIAVIDIIVRHLTALRDELATVDGEPKGEPRSGGGGSYPPPPGTTVTVT